MVTQNEKKIAEYAETILADRIQAHPELKEMLNNVSISPYTDFGIKVIIIKMPADLLREIRMRYKEFIKNVKKDHAHSIVLTMREGPIPARRGLTVVRDRETLINDMLFPAKVTGRSQEVENKDSSVQNIYLCAKQCYWAPDEVETLQKLAEKLFSDSFRFGMF